MQNRSDVRGTGGYLVAALKDQPSYFVTTINQERRRRGLPAVPVSGKPWNELDETEKRNVRHAQTQDRLQDAKDEAKLIELRAELARLKKLVGES